jgi:hypothetical protein
LTLPDEGVMESAVTWRHPEPHSSEKIFFWQRTSPIQTHTISSEFESANPPRRVTSAVLPINVIDGR